MVLGSFTVLGKPEQNRLKLQLHVDQQHNMVKNAKGLEQRRKRVALLKRAKELKETSMKARELGLRTEEVTRLRKVFNDVDDDNSGEISLEELVVLCKTIQGGRLSHLTKWDLQTYMDEADDDNSGTLGFDEFLQLVSPRREKYRADKLRKVQERLNKTKDNHSRMHNSRHKYAWNLYNKYQNQLDRFGRKQGYTQEALQHHVDQFELIDEDGSGSLDVEEILLVWKSLGNNNPPTREAAFEMMKPFDWRRAGRIDLMGFLEMMAPRRLKNMARQKAMQERMKRSLQKQKTLSKNVPLARMKLEKKHANAALKRWSRKLGYKDADVLTIRRQFNEVDTDHSGEIDVDELFHMLQKSHTVPSHLRNKTRLECIDVIDAYDQDKSGTIDFREFLHLISPRNAKYTEQHKMRQANAKQISEIKNMVFSQARYNAAMIKWNKHISRLWKHGQRMGFNNDEIEALKIEFDKYDSDGSGDIDLHELTAIVKGPAMNRPHLTHDDLKLMMNEFDYKNNGTINFAGFLEMMSPRRERAKQKYRNDLQELKNRANATNGLSSGNSIAFRSPRPPTLGSGRRKSFTNRSRRRRSGAGSSGIVDTRRQSTSGSFGRPSSNNEVDAWIDESKGASPKGKPPSQLLPVVYNSVNKKM